MRLHHAEHCLARHHAADPAEAVLDQVALQAAYALYKQRQQGSPGLRLAALPHASADQLFSLAFATVSAYGVSHWWKQNRATEPLDLVSRWR